MVGDRQLTFWQTMLSEHFNFDCEGLKMSGVTTDNLHRQDIQQGNFI